MKSVAEALATWSALFQVQACITSRFGDEWVSDSSGLASVANRAELNLSLHPSADPDVVAANRDRLAQQVGVPIAWLQQEHGTAVVQAEVVLEHQRQTGAGLVADAVVTTQPGLACAVTTADCLPVLLASVDGRGVAAVHAGWRGLAAGMIERAAEALQALLPTQPLSAFIGPAIGVQHFTVGPEVREAFLDTAQQEELDSTSAAFSLSSGYAELTGLGAPNLLRYQADLLALARLRLARVGVHSIFGGQWCTAANPESFFSYRRDRIRNGFASLIWIGQTQS